MTEADPRRRFSATVDDYVRYRPDYPSALFDWLAVDASLEAGDIVIDVGCGTGISTRQLAAHGLHAIGVEPNEDMLAAARSAQPSSSPWPRFVQGDAESFRIEPSEVAAIVGGQAFHWFDLDRALPHFASLLRPGGRVVAFWNLRDSSDALMTAYEALLREWCPEYERVGAEPRALALAEDARLLDLRKETFRHFQLLDRDGFFGRVWSSSYVRRSITDPARFDRALGGLFDAHAEEGFVRFVYRTLALSFVS